MKLFYEEDYVPETARELVLRFYARLYVAIGETYSKLDESYSLGNVMSEKEAGYLFNRIVECRPHPDMEDLIVLFKEVMKKRRTITKKYDEIQVEDTPDELMKLTDKIMNIIDGLNELHF